MKGKKLRDFPIFGNYEKTTPTTEELQLRRTELPKRVRNGNGVPERGRFFSRKGRRETSTILPPTTSAMRRDR